MSKWPMVRLDQLAADEKSAITKPYGSAMMRGDYLPEGIPVVRGVNLARGIFHDDDFVFISAELADSMPGARLAAGDLVFTHRGSVGQVSMIPRQPRFSRYAVSTSQVKARLNPSKASPEFYYYWFASPQGQHSILQASSTVGVPGIAQPVSTIKALVVPKPPLDVQIKIAMTLESLDKKIDSNRRAIDLTQQLSRSIFAMWSYRLSERLTQTTFGDFADVYGGATPKTDVPEYWTGTIPWATPTDITALRAPYLFRTSRTLSMAGLASTSATLHPSGTILMTSRATVGKFAVNEIPSATNQGFIAVRPKRKDQLWFLFEEMRSRVPEMLDRANGSTFLELSRGSFKTMAISVPDGSVIARLDHELAPLHLRASALEAESKKLIEMRDSLTAALMTGRVGINDASEFVGSVA